MKYSEVPVEFLLWRATDGSPKHGQKIAAFLQKSAITLLCKISIRRDTSCFSER